MKKIGIIAGILCSSAAFAQNNFPASGSVSINTSSAESGWLLDVNGLATAGYQGQARLYFGTADSMTSFIQSRDLSINQKLAFRASAFNFNTGNVGVGVNIPLEKLHVDGSALITGGLSIGYGLTGASSSPKKLIFGQDYSDGYTANKAKIQLFNDGSNIFAIGVGPVNDVQYHSGSGGAAGVHHFYSNNAFVAKIDQSGIYSSGRMVSGNGTNGGFENEVYVSGHNNIWRFKNSPEYGIAYYQGYPDYVGMHFGDRSTARHLFYQTGEVTHAGNVTAPTFIGNLNGNATSATTFGGQNGNFSVNVTSIANLVAQQPGGSLAVAGLGQMQNWLGLGASAYTAETLQSILTRGNAATMGANFGGSVGIGTATPDEKLTVNGKIHAKEIRVDATGLPDYVFEADYSLKTLAETEAFIRKYKHLPEVPSALEAEKNGLELGEMNKLLLKKIEELTLHLIEKEKEIKLLKASDRKTRELEARLARLEGMMRRQ